MLSLSAAASASWLPCAQNCSCMMVSCYCRRYYWFEVLDECNNLMLDTDGVGNALASILEDSKLQVWGCSIHFLLFCFCNTQVAGAERRRRCSQRCWWPSLSLSRTIVATRYICPHPDTDSGILTAGSRDGWAKCRERLCAIAPSNAQVRRRNQIFLLPWLTLLVSGHQRHRQRALCRVP